MKERTKDVLTWIVVAIIIVAGAIYVDAGGGLR